MTSVKPILVWRFPDAPQEYKDRSQHGGDEDWLAVVPASFYTNAEEDWQDPYWLQGSGRFGPCEISREVLPDGDVLFIGAHA